MDTAQTPLLKKQFNELIKKHCAIISEFNPKKKIIEQKFKLVKINLI